MSRDHRSRLTIASTFFALAVVQMASAFTPGSWGATQALLIFGFAALVLSCVLTWSPSVAALISRSPSGRVEPLRTLFGVVALVAILPAIIGAGLLLQQAPFGDAPQRFPGSMLAPFSLFPFACAYATLGLPPPRGKRRKHPRGTRSRNS